VFLAGVSRATYYRHWLAAAPRTEAIEEGFVRTAEDALKVLRQASQPPGRMGGEWLAQQPRRARGRSAVTVVCDPSPYAALRFWLARIAADFSELPRPEKPQ